MAVSLREVTMRAVLRSVVVALLLVLAGCGGSPAPTLTGIAVQPKSILSWPDQVFTAVGVYSDSSTGSLNAQVTWSDDAAWVRMDAIGGTATQQADAVCLAPAPVSGGMIPEPAPATITATATVKGTTFSATATLYCH
jgi:hypothetical protein